MDELITTLVCAVPVIIIGGLQLYGFVFDNKGSHKKTGTGHDEGVGEL